METETLINPLSLLNPEQAFVVGKVAADFLGPVENRARSTFYLDTLSIPLEAVSCQDCLKKIRSQYTKEYGAFWDPIESFTQSEPERKLLVLCVATQVLTQITWHFKDVWQTPKE